MSQQIRPASFGSLVILLFSSTVRSSPQDIMPGDRPVAPYAPPAHTTSYTSDASPSSSDCGDSCPSPDFLTGKIIGYAVAGVLVSILLSAVALWILKKKDAKRDEEHPTVSKEAEIDEAWEESEHKDAEKEVWIEVLQVAAENKDEDSCGARTPAKESTGARFAEYRRECFPRADSV